MIRARVLTTLAGDVLVATSRRRTLWLYLIASTAIVGVLVLGADLSVELRREEPAGPLPRTIALGGAVLPGSVVIGAADPPGAVDPGGRPPEGAARADAPDAPRLRDDGAGRLAGSAQGTVDYAQGLVSIAAGPDGEADVGAGDVGPLSVAYAVSLVGLAGDARARALQAGLATRLTLFGQTIDDRRLPSRYAAPYLLAVVLFNGLLIKLVASFFGLILGLLATSDAVSGALEPGAADLLLSRAIARHEVVAGRFLGALAFGVVQVTWLLGLALALCGLKFGVWVPQALLLVGPMALKFAVLLAVVTPVAVATRVPSLGLAAAAGVWVLSFAVYQLQANPTLAPAAVQAVDWAHCLLPQVAHLDDLASHVLEIPLEGGPQVSLQLVLGLACAWVAGGVGATALLVARRDF